VTVINTPSTALSFPANAGGQPNLTGTHSLEIPSYQKLTILKQRADSPKIKTVREIRVKVAEPQKRQSHDSGDLPPLAGTLGNYVVINFIERFLSKQRNEIFLLLCEFRIQFRFYVHLYIPLTVNTKTY
jgi:hypothetical protein